MIVRVLVKTVATVRARGMMYKAMDQSVLLYRSESLVVTGEMRKVLEGFHHRTVRRIMRMMTACGTGG